MERLYRGLKILKIPIRQSIDELEDILLVDYIVLYNRTLTNFNDRNFRKIHVFFLSHPTFFPIFRRELRQKMSGGGHLEHNYGNIILICSYPNLK